MTMNFGQEKEILFFPYQFKIRPTLSPAFSQPSP